MDYSEVEREIERLEKSETTYQNCSKLAVLYVVREHCAPSASEDIKTEYSFDGSEFMRLATKIGYTELLNVVDEYLDTIYLLHPKEYSAFIERLNSVIA